MYDTTTLQQAIEEFYAGQFQQGDFMTKEHLIVEETHKHYCPKCNLAETCTEEACQDIASLFCSSCTDLMIEEAVLSVTLDEYDRYLAELQTALEQFQTAVKKLDRVIGECPF